MADHVRAFDLQNTHYFIKYRRQTIERQVFGERFGRIETRQIERDDSKIWGQSGDDIAPIAMRLDAKSVNQQHGFAGRTAGFANPQRTTADELYVLVAQFWQACSTNKCSRLRSESIDADGIGRLGRTSSGGEQQCHQTKASNGSGDHRVVLGHTIKWYRQAS